jgi:hypothetical protein
MNFLLGNSRWTGTALLVCVLRKPSNIGINESDGLAVAVDITERRVKAGNLFSCVLGYDGCASPLIEAHRAQTNPPSTWSAGLTLTPKETPARSRCRRGWRSIRQRNFHLGIKPTVTGLYQFAKIVLSNSNGRVLFQSVGCYATVKATDDGIGIRILKKHERNPIHRRSARWRHCDPVQGRNPSIIRPAHHQIANIANKRIAGGVHIDPTTLAMLDL